MSRIESRMIHHDQTSPNLMSPSWAAKGISVLTVFIADDSPLVRERLGDLILTVRGVEPVGQAEDAPGAIEAIQRLAPDVVILDIRMPGGDGLQVLERVNVGESRPVVIVLTAFPYPQYRRRCLEAGAEYFLDKTTEFEQITQVLESLVRVRCEA